MQQPHLFSSRNMAASAGTLPLSGLKVVEMGGLAPAPFAGMILSDFGADVIRIDRPTQISTDILARNKRSIAFDLKKAESVQFLRRIIAQSDVLLDPFRPGVMERLGLGPDVLFKDNPRLIFARLSGFGQKGPGSQAAGHDVNYLAISGVLGMIGRRGDAPVFPMNVLADFAGGGLMCVMGILMALIERMRSGKGQVIDANLTSGTAYLTTFPYLMQKYGLNFANERGTNMLDSGAHFYEVYKTKDGLYMAVGAIEPQFYAELLKGLNIDPSTVPNQMDSDQWPTMKEKFAQIFATKTQAEWTSIFDGTDACVTPVLSFQESIPHATAVTIPEKQWPRKAVPPQPAPQLSRTPARSANNDDDAESPFLTPGSHSREILGEFGCSAQEIQQLIQSKAVIDRSSRL